MTDDIKVFVKGTRVRLNQDYGMGRAGDTGKVFRDSHANGLTSVMLDNGNSVYCFSHRMDAINDKGEYRVPELKQTYHCFKVADNGMEFKKLGDYDKTKTELHEALFKGFGEGTYFYKVKNEKVGDIITIKSPPKAFEVAFGFFGTKKD